MSVAPLTPQETPARQALREKCRDLEAVFLAEFLKATKPPPGSFNGGEGEAQFASLLLDEQAKAMAEQGGIGLAEQIFRSLAARGADA